MIDAKRIAECKLTANNILKHDKATRAEKLDAKNVTQREITLNDYWRMKMIANNIMKRTEKRF